MDDSATHEPTLGAILRQAREAAGLSIRQLEAQSGVGRMVISRLETDSLTELPSAVELSRLARALELNEADLFLIAGLPVPEGLASLDIMLRTAYGLPPEAVERVKRDIEDLVAEYKPQPSDNATNTQGGGNP